MKCGNCKNDHPSVADVKACYGVDLAINDRPLSSPSETEPVWDPRTPRNADHETFPMGHPADRVGTTRTPVPTGLATAPARTEAPATEKQINFLNKLLDERPMYRDVENLWPENVEKLSKRDISSKISEVMKVPKEVHAGSGKDSAGSLNVILADVPDCYVALPSRSGNNDLDFIRIGTNQGRMNPDRKGWRRVQRIVGGQAPISMRIGEAVPFARIVAEMTPAELKAAQVLFGHEIGSCGVCGKSLTDETSRARGIGPVCWEGF